MTLGSDDAPGNPGGDQNAAISAALAVLSAEQLHNVRGTAHRLKHLPFSRLVNVLLAEEMDAEADEGDANPSKQIVHDFADESLDRCSSAFTENLLERIEHELRSRARSDEKRD